MLTEEQNQVLKALYRRLHDPPLRAGVPEDMELYVPVYQETEGEGDPVQRLARHIEWEQLESLQLFSGFRGAGKTTELWRLKLQLEQKGYIVLYANALDYLSPAGELEIADFLLTLAGAFSDQLLEKSVLGRDTKLTSFWDRIPALFKELKISSVSIGSTLKLDLRASPTVRQQVQAALSNHVGTLKRKVDEFVRESVNAIAAYQPDSTREVVFLFDSLEQLRGTASSEAAVQASVERLFGQHRDKLKLPNIHLIYTVPPWLKFVSPGIGRVEILPSVRQWHRDEQRSADEAGNRALRLLIEKRLGDDGFSRFFSGPTQADKIVSVCGGHFRDLLLLLGESMRRAQSLPVSDQAIDQAIAAVRGQYLPISVEDATMLHRIAIDHCTDAQGKEQTARLTRFLDTHMVLYLRNGQEWYDVHPLIRSEVQEIVERDRRRRANG